MRFQKVTGKLGNMRRPADWVVYPRQSDAPEDETVLIQCEKRIARVSLKTGKAILSDGKGGHPSVLKLCSALGASVVDCPPDLLSELRALKIHVGPITIVG